MMKKFFGKLLATMLVLVTMLVPVTLTACGGGDDSRDPAHLTMWAGGEWMGTMGDSLQAFIDDYNAKHSAELGFDIKLRIVGDLEAEFTTALKKNEQPDIMIWDRFNTPTYSEQNRLLEIDNLISRDGVDKNLFLSQAMEELTYNGKTYGLPLDLDVWGVYVNTDMVDKYNAEHDDDITLNTDWTWEDMEAIAKKLTVTNGSKMEVAGYSSRDMHEHFFKFMVSAGVEFLDANGQPNFNNEQVKDILKYFVELKNANVSELGLTEKSNFTSSQLAMINQATYFSDNIKRSGKQINYKFMPQPRYSKEGGVNGGMIGGFGIAYPKPLQKFQTEKWNQRLENAWKFTKWWFMDNDRMIEWSKTTNTLPALLSTHDDASITENALLSNVLEYLPNYKIRPQLTGYLMMQTDVFNSTLQSFISAGRTDAGSINDCINEMIDGCLREMEQ